jgi:hypothetical protein
MHKKPMGSGDPAGLQKLLGQAAMGMAMGLALALLLILFNPAGVATLVDHGGTQAITVFVGTLVLTFGIGAAMTGAVFVIMEDH